MNKEKLKKLIEKKRNRKSKKLVNPIVKPRYDSVYFEGLAWLNSLK